MINQKVWQLQCSGGVDPQVLFLSAQDAIEFAIEVTSYAASIGFMDYWCVVTFWANSA